jgi:hypothetical protein
MPEFTANPIRRDPYKNFKFRIKWDGKYVAGLSKMSVLKRTTQVINIEKVEILIQVINFQVEQSMKLLHWSVG